MAKKGPDNAAIQSKAIEVLTQHRASPEATFLTVAQLLDRMGLPTDKIPSAISATAFSSRVVFAKKKTLDSPMVLAEDLPALAGSDALLQFALNEAIKKGNSSRSAKEFLADAGLDAKVKKPFELALKDRIAARTLPAGVSAVVAYPLTPTDVAHRLLQALRAEKGKGASAYPTPMPRLLELCGFSASEKVVKDGQKKGAFAEQAIVANIGVGFAVFPQDCPQLAQTPAIFEQLFDQARSKSRQSGAPPFTNVIGADELLASMGKMSAILAAGIREGIDLALAENRTPKGILWVRTARKVGRSIRQGVPLFFRVGDLDCPLEEFVRPSPSGAGSQLAPTQAAQVGAEPSPFAADFEAAYSRLDRETGSKGYVKLLLLRKALPNYTREAFDQGLLVLRQARVFTLVTEDGNWVTLTDEERGAGIQEGRSLFIYAQRR